MSEKVVAPYGKLSPFSIIDLIPNPAWLIFLPCRKALLLTNIIMHFPPTKLEDLLECFLTVTYEDDGPFEQDSLLRFYGPAGPLWPLSQGQT